MSHNESFEYIIPDFPLPDKSSSSSGGFEILTTIVVAAIEQEEKDTESSTAARKSIWRNREQADKMLTRNYFAPEPLYDDEVFRLRFRMSKPLFLKIVQDVAERFEYFREGIDSVGQRSFTPIQKCTSAIHQLAYGNIADNHEECLAISTRTSRECLQFFCNAIIKLYGKEFLHTLTSHNIARLYEAHGDRQHFADMIGSIDCTHWVWRGSPTALHNQYHRGDHEYPTIILEAVASQDLWFWHSYFGVAGSNNDINVLKQSPLFTPEMHGRAPELGFGVNRRQYKQGYYLTDGIYPSWSCFLK